MAAIAAVAAIISAIYGEVQRRAANKQNVLAQQQLSLAQEQAESRPQIKVGWASPNIKYEHHIARQAKLCLQIQNTGKVAARGVYLTLHFDQNSHLDPISNSSWSLGTVYPTPPREPITVEVDAVINATGDTKVSYTVISDESSSKGDLEIADLGI